MGWQEPTSAAKNVSTASVCPARPVRVSAAETELGNNRDQWHGAGEDHGHTQGWEKPPHKELFPIPKQQLCSTNSINATWQTATSRSLPLSILLNLFCMFGKHSLLFFFFFLRHMNLEIHTDNHISRISQPKQAGERSCIPTTLPLMHPFCISGAQQAKNAPVSQRWCARDQNAPAQWGSEKGNMWKSLPRRGAAFGEISSHRNSKQNPAHQEEGEVGKAAAHQVPWCPLEAQILPPSTKLCFFVSWTTKKHLCVSQSQTPPKIQRLL